MQNLNKLKEAFERIGYSPNTGKIAFDRLSNILNSSEIILHILEGSHESTVGVLVATDLRLLYVGCSPLKDSVIESLSYEKIESIQFKKGEMPISGSVEIKEAENIVVKGVSPKEAHDFIEKVNILIEQKKTRSEDMSGFDY
jgi:hypothetical protein